MPAVVVLKGMIQASAPQLLNTNHARFAGMMSERVFAEAREAGAHANHVMQVTETMELLQVERAFRPS